MALLAGIMIGLLLALPPGGVTLVGVNLSMTRGFRGAVPYAYGTATVDVIYALLAVMGARAVGDFYQDSVQSFPAVLIGMQVLIITGLFSYGTYLLFRRTPMITRNADGSFSVDASANRQTRRTPFLLGLALNFSNIFSPTFLAALAVVASQAQAFGVLEGNVTDNILYAVGFGIGSTIYMQLCMKLAERYTKRLEDKHVLRLQKAAGIAFTAIGSMLLITVIGSWV